MSRPERFDIYRNLNKRKGNPSLYVWSLRLTGGRVQGHSETALLLDPEFKVSKTTQARIVLEGRRKVCAFIRGTLATCDDLTTQPLPPRDFKRIAPAGPRVRISFNPYAAETFYRCDTHAPVTAADAVIFTSGGCYAINPR